MRISLISLPKKIELRILEYRTYIIRILQTNCPVAEMCNSKASWHIYTGWIIDQNFDSADFAQWTYS